MPGVIAFWPTLVFYLVAIRFHIFSINNRKTLLTSVKKIITQARPGWNNPLALAQNWHWDGRPESYHRLPFLEEEWQLFTLAGVTPPRKSKAYFVRTVRIGSLWQGPCCSLWCCRWVDNRTERLADCPSSSYGLVSDCSWPTPWWWAPGPPWEGREHNRSGAGGVPHHGWSGVPLPKINRQIGKKWECREDQITADRIPGKGPVLFL